MSLLKKRIQRIKKTLGQDDLDMAATLLINTVSSDDMFEYWSGCCHGSERVPKILKYIKHISFNPTVPTAVINFMEGDLMIGTRFFLDHIDGPEDLLFILIHERNHLILRKLYPDVFKPDYPKHLFNFAEDVFINAISRRHIPSALPERFYHKPLELLLTARHNRIDWEHFKLNEHSTNRIKDAHAAFYLLNYSLLKALKETRIVSGRACGYRQWMELMLEWHQKMQEQSRKASREQKGSDNGEVSETDTDTEQSANDHGDNEDKAEPVEDTKAETSDDSPDDAEPIGEDYSETEEGEREVLKSDKEDEHEDHQVGECGANEIEKDNDREMAETNEAQAEDTVSAESEQGREDKGDEQDHAANAIDYVLKRIVPLVQDDSSPPVMDAQAGVSEKANNMVKQPLPNRVAGGFSPPAPTPPGKRVRTGRFT